MPHGRGGNMDLLRPHYRVWAHCFAIVHVYVLPSLCTRYLSNSVINFNQRFFICSSGSDSFGGQGYRVKVKIYNNKVCFMKIGWAFVWLDIVRNTVWAVIIAFIPTVTSPSLSPWFTMYMSPVWYIRGLTVCSAVKWKISDLRCDVQCTYIVLCTSIG